MRPQKLEFINHVGAGPEIHAEIPKQIKFPEGTMKAGPQKLIIGCAPWIQFPKEEWDDMVSEVFAEMVELWNNKYTNNNST